MPHIGSLGPLLGRDGFLFACQCGPFLDPAGPLLVPQELTDAFEKMCDGIFGDAPTMAMLRAANHRPLALIEYAQAVLARQFLPASDVGNQPAKATLYEQLLRSVRGLGVPLGGCERIQG